jgi:hypothetical protein
MAGSEVAVREEVEHERSTEVTLFGSTEPTEVIARASEIASALADVIGKQKLYVGIQGKNHVLVEGWTVLGSMVGVFPVLESCEAVTIDGVDGFVATVAAQTINGNVVGKASAFCMRNEKRWAKADTYAVASMAQTRATSKALRIPLGFVMSLAGYEATPAEEREANVRMVERLNSEQLGELLEAIDANEDAPELWAVDVVLASASRKFGRKLEFLGDLTPAEARLIIEGAKAWRGKNPLEEVEADEIEEVEEIEFAPDLPVVEAIEKDNE